MYLKNMNDDIKVNINTIQNIIIIPKPIGKFNGVILNTL